MSRKCASMNFKTIVAVVGTAFVGSALAQEPAAPTQQAFDATGVYPATSFLPPAYLVTGYYQIDSSVYNDGIYNTWRVFSRFGTYEVTGNERLMILLRELAAIATIESESNAKRFAEAMKGAGEEKLRDAESILRNPAKTAREIPQGASRLFGRVGNTIKHAAEGTLQKSDDDGEPGDRAKKLIGVDAAKRQLAAQLGVNPYSANAALQKALNDAAWATSLGKVTMNIASGMVVPPGVGQALTGIGVTDFLTSDQVKMRPEDLAKQNKATLASLGVDEDTQEQLLNNPYYDLWTLSAMLNAVSSLGLNEKSEVFFDLAGTAFTDIDAYFFFRSAQLMASYHKNVAPLIALEAGNKVVFCRDQNGKLIAPLWIDYLGWTPTAAAAAQRLQNRAGKDGVTGVVILASGDFTPLALSNLNALGFEVVSRAFQQPASAQ